MRKSVSCGMAFGLALTVCAFATSAAGGDVFGTPVKVKGTTSKMMAVCLEGNRL